MFIFFIISVTTFLKSRESRQSGLNLCTLDYQFVNTTDEVYSSRKINYKVKIAGTTIEESILHVFLSYENGVRKTKKDFGENYYKEFHHR